MVDFPPCTLVSKPQIRRQTVYFLKPSDPTVIKTYSFIKDLKVQVHMVQKKISKMKSTNSRASSGHEK